MTDVPFRRDEEMTMCVRAWLEVGHACEPRSSAFGRALALDWRVWVRGVSGHDISSFVHKVVFYLHPATEFVYPKRVRQEPPFEIQESGCASIEIPIHVYLKHSVKPNKIRLKYSLKVENNLRSSSESCCVYYDFENPPERLWKALVDGGGEVIARATCRSNRSNKLVVVLSESDSDRHHRAMKAKKYKFIEPIHCKHGPKKRSKSSPLDEVCPKCGDSINESFKKQLRLVSMTDDEINRVSQLYLSCNSYQRSRDALMLPPLSDPIYRVPDLPISLRGLMKKIKTDNYV